MFRLALVSVLAMIAGLRITDKAADKGMANKVATGDEHRSSRSGAMKRTYEACS